MAKLKLRTTILSKLSTLTRSEGNLVITRDGETLYFDTDTKRFKISDFIDVADDNDRLAILAPNTEKMYYVLSTNAVWRYISGTWYEVTSTEDVSDIISSLSNKADSNKAYLTDDSTSTDIADGDYIPLSSANAKKKSTFSNFVAKIKAKLITDTYSGTSTTGMSGKAVKSAIDALDGTVTGSPSASKTLTAFSQTDGKVSATFGDINISKSQINDFPTIPTVNNATLTIQKNGTNVQTFTANASSNKTANITVPVTQADLTEVRLTNEDLDDVTYPGFYYAGGGNTVTNKPTGYNNFGLVVVHNAAQSQYTQVISNENGSYRRIKKADGTWTSWAEDKFTDTTYSFADGTNQFTVTPSGSTASTIKVTPQLKIDGITSDTTDKEINCYGECSTAASTAAKTVSITKGTFALGVGAKVIVKFTNANTANNPTLNVNSKGAKNIFHNGARITTGANKALLAGTVEFVYDGTQFQLVGNYIDTDTTYTFAGGTDKFTVTPSGGSAQTVNVANGGVRSVATGSTFGTYSVNTGGTSTDTAINLTGDFQSSGQNLNDIKTSGVYYFSSGNVPTNVPAGTNGILIVTAAHISSTTGLFVKQVWMRHGTNDSTVNTEYGYYGGNDYDTFIRTYNNSTWSSWHRVLTTISGTTLKHGLTLSSRSGQYGTRSWTELVVGNSVGVGTPNKYDDGKENPTRYNGSQCGRIKMYNSASTDTATTAYATVLTPGENTAQRTITFPNDDGTVALTKNIPTVNNATLNIQLNGTTVDSFTANASSNVTANIKAAVNNELNTEDLNTVKVPGFYVGKSGNSCANKPSGVAQFGLYVIKLATSNNNYWKQTLFQPQTVANGGFKTYSRSQYNGTWTNWDEEACPKSCLVGQSAVVDANTPVWYKVASVSITTTNTDTVALFAVTNMYNKNSECSGILRAHVRTNSSKKVESAKLTWVVNSGFSIMDGFKFLLVYPSTASPTIELWTKVDEDYQSRRFTVISDGNRTTAHLNMWTLYNAYGTGEGQSAHTSGSEVYVDEQTPERLRVKDQSTGYSISYDILNRITEARSFGTVWGSPKTLSSTTEQTISWHTVTELCMIVNMPNNINISIVVPAEEITTTAKSYRGGYYYAAGECGEVSISVKLVDGAIVAKQEKSFQNGSNVLSSTTTKVYCR